MEGSVEGVRRLIMKRYTFWIGTALLTFVVGVTCASLWSLDHELGEQKANAPLVGKSVTSELEMGELSICQLETNAEEYEGKIVRVRAVYSLRKHGPTLEDLNCSSARTGIWVSVTPAMWNEIDRATVNAYGIKNAGGPLEILAVGRFGRNNPAFSSDSWADRLPFKFELMRIEKATGYIECCGFRLTRTEADSQ